VAVIGSVGADWRSKGLCRGKDTDLWYPGRGGDQEPAKQVCAVCPVQEACLEYALAARERFGIWGGASERERRRMIRSRRAAA
jgi:WhiB family redox-sensing transcriptional regulator